MDVRSALRSRRSILAASVGMLGAALGGRLLDPEAVTANAGDPMVLGDRNVSGRTTHLVGLSSDGPALRLTQYEPAGGGALEVHGGAWVDGGLIARGDLGVGVSGQATSGTGVVAAAEPAGVALRVTGRASFSRSGVATVRAGSRTVTVSRIGLLPSAFVVATLQQYRSGVHLVAADPSPSTGTITIHLNKAVSADTTVGWLVLG